MSIIIWLLPSLFNWLNHLIIISYSTKYSWYTLWYNPSLVGDIKEFSLRNLVWKYFMSECFHTVDGFITESTQRKWISGCLCFCIHFFAATFSVLVRPCTLLWSFFMCKIYRLVSRVSCGITFVQVRLPLLKDFWLWFLNLLCSLNIIKQV